MNSTKYMSQNKNIENNTTNPGIQNGSPLKHTLWNQIKGTNTCMSY